MTSRLLQRLLNSHKALGQLTRFPEQVGGHDSQSQSDPLLSLAPFVAIQKQPSLHELPVNRLPAAKDRKRQKEKEGKKAARRRGGWSQEGRAEEVNEYTRPLFSLLLKWRVEQNLPP